MYKKISGADQSTCRQNMVDAKQEMINYNQHLKGKKEEYHQMVQANEVEREEMRKQERIASMFKFGKMAKKHVFMPSLDARGEFDLVRILSYDHKIPYTEGRAKEALIFPKKVKDYTKEWDL